MALGRGQHSETTGTIKKPSIEPLCEWIKSMATDLSKSDGQRTEKIPYSFFKWIEWKIRKKLGKLAENVRV
jgi:hypothetical protein